MKWIIRQFLTFACIMYFAAFVQADLISSVTLQQSGGMSGQMRFVLEFTTDNSWGTDPVTPLFDQVISASDVGKTFSVNNASPFFAKNIDLATDGNNNRVGFSMISQDSGAGSLFYEAEFFFGAPHSPFYLGKADLKGKSIKRVTMHLDQFTVTPTTQPAQGPWDDYSFKGMVSFFDDTTPRETPEPATCCLALLSGIGLAIQRFRATASSDTPSGG